ncbi:MAG: DUF1572 family protein [Chitinophagaceae bacterium]
MSIEEQFLSSAIKRLEDYKKLGEKTIDLLTFEQLNWRPNETSNSIAIIIKHMHGNMLSRWTNFLTEDGEKQWRKRDEEFEGRNISKEQILEWWNEGWLVCLNSIKSLLSKDLIKTITIRQDPLNVIDAINRQIAHYSYHVGQIVYIGKSLIDSNWVSLSIPKGLSQQYNKQLNK